MAWFRATPHTAAIRSCSGKPHPWSALGRVAPALLLWALARTGPDATFVSASIALVEFSIGLTGLSVVMAWVLNNCGGSTLMAILLHAASTAQALRWWPFSSTARIISQFIIKPWASRSSLSSRHWSSSLRPGETWATGAISARSRLLRLGQSGDGLTMKQSWKELGTVATIDAKGRTI